MNYIILTKETISRVGMRDIGLTSAAPAIYITFHYIINFFTKYKNHISVLFSRLKSCLDKTSLL